MAELAEPPNGEEILRALGQLAVGKAGSMNGLLPDVLKCCGGPLVEYISVLFQTVRTERRVPSEWRDALLLSSCAEEGRFVLL